MDDGGNKSEFELEVNDSDIELVGADIESPSDEADDTANGEEAPKKDSEVVEGDLPAPDDDPLEDELDSELDALEAEEKAEEDVEAKDDEKAEESVEATDEEKAVEASDAAEASEETTVAAEAESVEVSSDEIDEEEKPADEEEKPTEEDKPEEEKTEEPEAEAEPVAEGDVAAEDEAKEDAPAEDEEKAEKPADEDKPADEEKPAEEAPIVVDGANAPVDSTQANSKFPVEPAEEKKKSNKTGLFVMIAIIILLLIGCGIFFLISNGSNKDNKGGNNNQGSSKEDDDLPPSKVDGLSEFDVKLLQDFQDNKNVVYSPMSIKYAMSVLMEGTDGSTKQELVDVIGDYKPTSYTNSEHLAIANAFFVKDVYKDTIRTAYTDAIKQKYGANTIYDPFNNAATINDWVYTNTLKLIPSIITDNDLKEAVFVIGNTVAIDMDWENVIQCSYEIMDKCKGKSIYGVAYDHEKYSHHVNIYDDDRRSKVKLNGKEALAMDFGASINNYDIVKELGEDKIRSIVKADYEKCVANKKYEYECELGSQTIDQFLDNYIKSINQNYGKVASSTDFMMHVDDDIKVFAKDFKEYDGAQLQYVAVMPKSKSLNDYIKSMTKDSLVTVIGSLKDIKKENFTEGKITKITGLVPEFNFNEKYDLVDEFKALGVNKAFQDDADLSKMFVEGAEDRHVGAIKHAAKIEFSNTGVKAAGATVVIGVGNAEAPMYDYEFEVPVEEIDMTFDKPFLYLIRDKATGEVWFMGTVYEGKAPKK